MVGCLRVLYFLGCSAFGWCGCPIVPVWERIFWFKSISRNFQENWYQVFSVFILFRWQPDVILEWFSWKFFEKNAPFPLKGYLQCPAKNRLRKMMSQKLSRDAWMRGSHTFPFLAFSVTSLSAWKSKSAPFDPSWTFFLAFALILPRRDCRVRLSLSLWTFDTLMCFPTFTPPGTEQWGLITTDISYSIS